MYSWYLTDMQYIKSHSPWFWTCLWFFLTSYHISIQCTLHYTTRTDPFISRDKITSRLDLTEVESVIKLRLNSEMAVICQTHHLWNSRRIPHLYVVRIHYMSSLQSWRKRTPDVSAWVTGLLGATSKELVLYDHLLRSTQSPPLFVTNINPQSSMYRSYFQVLTRQWWW